MEPRRPGRLLTRRRAGILRKEGKGRGAATCTRGARARVDSAGSPEVRAGRGRAPRAEKRFRGSLSARASFRGPGRPLESSLGSPLAQRGRSPSFRHAKARIVREWASDRAYRPELYVERRPGNLHKGPVAQGKDRRLSGTMLAASSSRLQLTDML